jgi:hypothetical protein
LRSTLTATTLFVLLLYALWTLPKFPIPTTSYISKSVILGFLFATTKLGSVSFLAELSGTVRVWVWNCFFCFLFRVRTRSSCWSSISWFEGRCFLRRFYLIAWLRLRVFLGIVGKLVIIFSWKTSWLTLVTLTLLFKLGLDS